MLLNRLHGNLPAEHRVALFAVRAKLAAVNIRMAIRAIFGYIGKHGFCVAPGARSFFVHAAQRILRRIVIEFGNRADGRPTRVRMAIFAGDCEWSVRTSARLPLGSGRHNEG